MEREPVPVDEAEFKKSFRRLMERLKALRNGLRRRMNRDILWRF